MKQFKILFECLCFLALLLAFEVLPVKADSPHYTIVIDPGHGGENEGTIEGKTIEKEMTLYTANKLVEELSVYDNLDVYITRTEDVDISLKKRAEYAKSVDADFLISIHYNASVDHDLFGSEVWIPSGSKLNEKSYPIGWSFLNELKQTGLFIRGIKIKYNSKQKDYYGIIRESAEFGIPAMIFEHCHVDEDRDSIFCDSPEQLAEFARLDAIAIAKALNLSLKNDPESNPYDEFHRQIPEGMAVLDETEPELCSIKSINADYEGLALTLEISGYDAESPLIYYDYSLDGGLQFGKLIAWQDSDTLQGTYADSFTVTVPIPDGLKPEVIVRAYNQYDLFTQSNILSFDQAFEKPVEEPSVPEEELQNSKDETIDLEKRELSATDSENDYFLEIIIIVIIIVFILSLSFIMTLAIRKHQRRSSKQRK